MQSLLLLSGMWLASKFILRLFKNLASVKAQACLAGEALTTVTSGRSLGSLWFLLIQSPELQFCSIFCSCSSAAWP